MKHAIAVLALAAFATVAPGREAARAGERVEREDRRTIDAAGKTELVVKNARGRTVVVGKGEARVVTVVVKKTAKGRDAEDAERLLDDLEVEIGARGDEVFVETGEQAWSRRGLWALLRGGHRSAWADYTIEVPYAFSVTAVAASGEVRLSNIGGDATVTAASGDVGMRAIGGKAQVWITSGDLEAVGVGGDMEVTATSGNVVVDNVKGALRLTGTSGDFRASRIGRDVDAHLSSGGFVLEGCSGDVKFRASSGDGAMSEVTGSVKAVTSSGDLEVMIIPVSGRTFELSSSSGDIDVHYVAVADFGFELDVQTASGTIEGNLPIKVRRVDRRRLQGVVGTGAARLEIETASGDVTIVERDEAVLK